MPGGGTTLFGKDKTPSKYQKAATEILKFAKSQNDKGTYFPVLGTCLGFQSMIMSLMGETPDQMYTDYADSHVGHRITKTDQFSQSKFWTSLDQEILQKSFDSGNVFYVHSNGFDAEALMKDERFTSKMLLTSTSLTDAGIRFAASVESKDYPFFMH